MIRLRHKMLIHSFRVFDQLALVITGIGIKSNSIGILAPGRHYSIDVQYYLNDAALIIVLLVGWYAIFYFFVQYKTDRLVAINTQLNNLSLIHI